jgi:hypothetical protein
VARRNLEVRLAGGVRASFVSDALSICVRFRDHLEIHRAPVTLVLLLRHDHVDRRAAAQRGTCVARDFRYGFHTRPNAYVVGVVSGVVVGGGGGGVVVVVGGGGGGGGGCVGGGVDFVVPGVVW